MQVFSISFFSLPSKKKLGYEYRDSDDDEKSVDDDRFPRQLAGLLALEHEDEARQREDEGQAAGGPGVTDDRPHRREEASDQGAHQRQGRVEDDHVDDGRPDRSEKRVHHLMNKYAKG